MLMLRDAKSNGETYYDRSSDRQTVRGATVRQADPETKRTSGGQSRAIHPREGQHQSVHCVVPEPFKVPSFVSVQNSPCVLGRLASRSLELNFAFAVRILFSVRKASPAVAVFALSPIHHGPQQKREVCDWILLHSIFE